VSKEQVDELFLALGFKNKDKFVAEVDNLLEVLDKFEEVDDTKKLELEWDASFPDLSRVNRLIEILETYLTMRYPEKFERIEPLVNATTAIYDRFKRLVPLFTDLTKEQKQGVKYLLDLSEKLDIEGIKTAKKPEDFDEIQKNISSLYRALEHTKVTNQLFKTTRGIMTSHFKKFGLNEDTIVDLLKKIPKELKISSTDIPTEISLKKSGEKGVVVRLDMFDLKNTILEIPSNVEKATGEILHEADRFRARLKPYFKELTIEDVEATLNTALEKYKKIKKDLPKILKDWEKLKEMDSKNEFLTNLMEEWKNIKTNILLYTRELQDAYDSYLKKLPENDKKDFEEQFNAIRVDLLGSIKKIVLAKDTISKDDLKKVLKEILNEALKQAGGNTED
jgi:hypothetical protein